MNHLRSLTPLRQGAVEAALPGACGVKADSVMWNEYSSTFDSFVVRGEQAAAFVKFGESYCDPYTHHRRGLAHEISFYSQFAPGPEHAARLIASGSTAAGEDFVILDLLEGPRLEHDTRSGALERAIVGLAEIHDVLDSIYPPPASPNLFGPAFFEAWAGRIEPIIATWARDYPWTRDVGSRLAEVFGRADHRSSGVIHGELFPSNVIVAGDLRPRFVDWDAWGRGPRVLDLAALTLGWPGAAADWCVETYQRACERPGAMAVSDLQLARLHYGLLSLWGRHRQALAVDPEELWLQDVRACWSALEARDISGEPPS